MSTRNTFKKAVKLMISIVFFIACVVRDSFRHLTGQTVPGSAVILYYHAIRPDQHEQFARQMDTLIRWAEPLDVSFGSRLTDSGRFAAVTFDDGFVSFLETALPELKKRQIPATLFVVADKLGCYADWDEYMEDPLFKEPIMSLEQLRSLPSELVTIGSHTLTHPFLTRLSESEAKRELLESRVRLEKLLGKTITLFSFPHGDFNANLVDWCREAGYERVFTILPTRAFSDPREYAVGRVSVGPADWPLEFKLKLLGAYRWLPMAFRLKRKVRAVRVARKLAEWKGSAR